MVPTNRHPLTLYFIPPDNMLRTISIILLIVSGIPGFCQRKDYIIFQIKKDSTAESGFDRFSVRAYNPSDTPVCIMHSIFINLIEEPPQKLAVFRSNYTQGQLFSLEYTMRDTAIDYEGDIVNFNAEPILPLQDIKFSLLIPKSSVPRRIKMEYLLVPDLCYKDFKKRIFENATNWYFPYKRIKKELVLPE